MKLYVLPILALLTVATTAAMPHCDTREHLLGKLVHIKPAYKVVERLPQDAVADDYADALLELLKGSARLSTRDKKKICHTIIHMRCRHGDTCSSTSRGRKKEAKALLNAIEAEERREQDELRRERERDDRARRAHEEYKTRHHEAKRKEQEAQIEKENQKRLADLKKYHENDWLLG